MLSRAAAQYVLFCAHVCGYANNAKFRHYYITYLYEVLCSLRWKEKQKFLPIFFSVCKKKHYAIWCEFSAPGFISPYTLYNKYIIIKFVVCNSLLLYLYLCDGHCVFAFVYLLGPIFCLCYYSYLAIVGTDVRIYIPLRWMQWDRFTAVDL